MSEGIDAGAPRPAPREVKEPLKPAAVELRRIEAASPRDVQRYFEIDQALDPDKWVTARQPLDQVRAEIEEHAATVPFIRKDPEPEFYLFGVSEKSRLRKPGQPGELHGFVSTYDDEYLERVKNENPELSALLSGVKARELSFAGHPDSTHEQMVEGVKLGVGEIVEEHALNGQGERLAITSYVQEDPDEARVLEQAGFVKQGTFDLRDEGEPDPSNWDMYVYVPQSA